MSRWFNIAGPCQDDIHYMLSPTAQLPDLEELIQQRSYFVVHAPRQTGKTTAMLALAKQLTESGRYTAVSSLTLRNFNAAEEHNYTSSILTLLLQVFTQLAKATAFDLTQGQPWLVNALVKEIVEKMVKDRSIAITHEHVLKAKEILIARQDTHLDSLAEKLREKRVKDIIEPMLAGLVLGDTPADDRQYLIDLGLLRRDPAGGLVIANPIYREVIPRVLVQGTQDSLPHISPSWLTDSGELNIDYLLQAFIRFWRQHGEPLLGSTGYYEVAPHIVLMAFLHRVVNGGGTLEREYAIGSDRMDLCP